MWLGKAINGVQRFWSADNASKYSHAGIIISKRGKTLESLWTVSSQDIYEAYKDNEVLIARHKNMTYDKFIEGYFGIQNHIVAIPDLRAPFDLRRRIECNQCLLHAGLDPGIQDPARC